MKKFPVAMTGAIYWFDDFPIFSIESRQVDQFDDEKLAGQ
jgi:hypothetical protein